MESPDTLVQPSSPGRIRPREPPPGREVDLRPDGLLLGRYRLLQRLGAGGFGVVWRARDELLGREVAVKRIWLGPQGDVDRAAREAQAAARLSHPAIVALYEACTMDDAFLLISELVDGRTLAELIAADCLEDEEVLEIGLAMTAALAHAHARGVVHRDIKPQNVLVPNRSRGPGGASGELPAAAKLTDFGGATLAGEEALTRTGDVFGTLAYMAPEQSEGRTVGAQADLYALALVLYEALSGVNPVRGLTPAATARRIGTRLEPLRRHRPDLPRELTDAVDGALAPHPADRGDMHSLREALSESLDGDRRRRHPRPAPNPARAHPHRTRTPAGGPLSNTGGGARGGGARRCEPRGGTPPGGAQEPGHRRRPGPGGLAGRRRASGGGPARPLRTAAGRPADGRAGGQPPRPRMAGMRAGPGPRRRRPRRGLPRAGRTGPALARAGGGRGASATGG